VGNAVFDDLNGNGTFDSGEGIPGVTLKLFPSTETNPATGTALETTVTSSEGTYYFGNLLPPGTYYIYLPASNFVSPGKLAAKRPMPGQGGDTGLDDNQDENGDDPANPSLTGVRSNVFALTAGGEPVDEGAENGMNSYMDASQDANNDMTIDFGFYTPMAVGNLVYHDLNANGVAEPLEGLGGVEVRLYRVGKDPQTEPPIATTITSSDSLTLGRFMFTNVRPGDYFLHVPRNQFSTGMILHNKVSIAGSSATGDDSSGENGLDSYDPLATGVSTEPFNLTPGQEPAGTSAATGEPGRFGSDDNGINGLVDTNSDLTQDFGFVNRVCLGNLIFMDHNGSGIYDPGIDVGLDGVFVNLFRQPASGPAILVSTTLTANGGKYQFCTSPGNNLVRNPATMFQRPEFASR
jgi:hypothetical protein